MTEIASYVFTANNMEIAIHGSKRKFPLIQAKLELLMTSLKNENSRFNIVVDNDSTKLVTEFDKPIYYKNFFKTPLTVNNCTESLISAPFTNHEDYAALMVLGDLMTFNYMLPSIREKGGAYGTGC